MHRRALTDNLRILALLLLLAWIGGPAIAAEPGWKKSTRHGITVTVVPVRMEAGAGPWEFLVSLESHARGHLDALPERAALSGAGNAGEQASIQWQPPPALATFRLGTVRFRPIAPQPDAIELSVTVPGERTPRRFRWKLER